MIYPVPFQARHAGQLTLQSEQAWLASHWTPAMLEQLECLWAHTLMKDGRPVLCGGIVTFDARVGTLWAFLSADIRPADFVSIHRHVDAFIRGVPFERLEMYVDAEFTAAHRWARRLGFACICERMKGFQANGGDCARYVRESHG